jgi:tRNA threonylcarbamoyladenosine biosynthesis protein TsaE
MDDNYLRLHCNHIDQLYQVAQQIADFAGDERIWLFYGEMGAGKTTLIKAICNIFGVQDLVNSPTFALVNEYRNAASQVFYHFDFYRIQNLEEALDIGVEDYFYSGHYCFIEWPSNISVLIPEDHLSIHIEVTNEDSRSIYLKKHERSSNIRV